MTGLPTAMLDWVPRVATFAACVWAGSACASLPTEVVRLPPLELALGPGGDPLVAWPTSSPPAPIDAFQLQRQLMGRSWWRPQIDYCIDQSGRVTSVEVFRSRVPRRIERAVRGWSFAPWDGSPEARFCESVVMYDDEATLGRFERASIAVFLPVVPPVLPLPGDGSLAHAPARMLPNAQGSSFWDVIPEGHVFEPGFGEIVLQFCTDSEGRTAKTRALQLQFDGRHDNQATLLTQQLVRHIGGWHFVPRLEGGVPVEDCEVEVRYAVWIIQHELLRHHERLFDILDVKGSGLPFRPASDELIPWAEHGPLLPLDGGPTPSMVEMSSWLPPYELAATMPAAMPLRTVRVRFCVPTAGGYPSEVRVLQADTQGPERAIARLVAEGVARWRADVTQGVNGSTVCSEVEWRLERRAWTDPGIGR